MDRRILVALALLMVLSGALGVLSADFPAPPPAWTIEPATPAQVAPVDHVTPVVPVDDRAPTPV